MMKISEKMVVTTTYDLYVQTGEEQPELMESATAERPLTFCFGLGMMLPKFEAQLQGLTIGDKYDFTIACADAYGEHSEEHILDLPKNIFEIDGQFDSETIYAGNIVPLMDAEGNRFNAEVLSVSETSVSVDLNHPLAGEDLHFVGEVIGVHEASDEELKAFMNPSGGGCGSCNCGDGGCGDGGCDTHESDGGGCGSGCGCH